MCISSAHHSMWWARCLKTATHNSEVLILIADSSEAQEVCMAQLIAISFTLFLCTVLSSEPSKRIDNEETCHLLASKFSHVLIYESIYLKKKKMINWLIFQLQIWIFNKVSWRALPTSRLMRLFSLYIFIHFLLYSKMH